MGPGSVVRILSLFVVAGGTFAAGDPWVKVIEIKSGSDLRIFKKGVKQPLIAKMDEAMDDKIIVVVKDEQVAVSKDQIDRLDARPPQTASRITNETKSGTTDPSRSASPRDAATGSATPGTSSSTSMTIGSKPDFQTVYRRPPAVPPASK